MIFTLLGLEWRVISAGTDIKIEDHAVRGEMYPVKIYGLFTDSCMFCGNIVGAWKMTVEAQRPGAELKLTCCSNCAFEHGLVKQLATTKELPDARNTKALPAPDKDGGTAGPF